MLTLGLLLVLASLVSRVGSLEFVTTGSQFLALGVGLALLAVGLVVPAVSARSMNRQLSNLGAGMQPSEAQDAEFLLKAFYLAMPPAFIKRVELDGPTPRAVDILYSRELDRFQRSRQTTTVSEGTGPSLIQADHADGDARALQEQWSVQLELPDSYVRGRLFPILTYKTRFEHKGRTYIAGWYVPVELGPLDDDTTSVWLREEIGQILFRLATAKDGEGSQVVVGQALRALRRQKAPKRRRTAEDPPEG